MPKLERYECPSRCKCERERETLRDVFLVVHMVIRIDCYFHWFLQKPILGTVFLDNKLDIDVLDEMDIILLDSVFTLEEIKVIVKHNKAPGHDDLPIVLSKILTCYRS